MERPKRELGNPESERIETVRAALRRLRHGFLSEFELRTSDVIAFLVRLAGLT